MAQCPICKQEMLRAPGCTASTLVFKPKRGASCTFPKIRYGEETRYGSAGRSRRRCHDCGVQPGNIHHPGCDWEECPRCHGQLIGCNCNDKGTFSDAA